MRTIPILVAAMSLLLWGCDTGTQQRVNCVVLIDYSGSLPEQTLHRYVDIISSEVLRHLGPRDRMVVLPIDEGARREDVKLVYDDMADHQFVYTTDGYTHASDSLRMRLREYADENGPRVAAELLREKELRQKYTYYTDIFAAIEQASQLLERNEADSFWQGVGRFVTGKKRVEPTNVLLIFSDMIQESNECSFAGPEGCSSDQGRAIIGRLKASNRIPDLHGCMVFVDGRTGKTNTQVENIQKFWEQYFKAAHATLAAYDYDSGSQITTFLGQRVIAAR